MQIVVDAYDEVERAMGWHCYLQDNLAFPFKARCIAERITSPLLKKDIVDVIDIAPSDECEKEMLVVIRWQTRTLAVPLSQLEGIKVDEATEEAIGDWRYWVKSGYMF